MPVTQTAVLAALDADDPTGLLSALAVGPRVIECPDLGSGRLVFPRYRDVRFLLRDPRFISGPTASGLLDELSPQVRPIVAPVASWILYADPPLHPRLRSLLSKTFTPRRITGLHEEVQNTASSLVQGFAAGGGGNAVSALTTMIPVHVISSLLGIPESDRDEIKALSDDVILLTEPSLCAAQEQALASAWAKLTEYFGEAIESRRRQPQDDLISSLIQAEADGDRLTREEITANCIALLVGGHETTGSLLSALVLATVGHPELRDEVSEDTDAAAGFVEEVLRLDGPSKITARTAATDTDVLGIPVSAGQRLILLQATANRDPEVFESADEFNYRRSPNRHVSFGFGPHACFGAALARIEAIAFIQAYMRHSDRLIVDTSAITWKPSRVIRSAARIPVTIHGSEARLGG